MVIAIAITITMITIGNMVTIITVIIWTDTTACITNHADILDPIIQPRETV
ncbi:MAG: hypothetical protein JNK39_09340 [Nitrosomonas sp.]|nr:hypothetical protein [Nitrosomonas sp.]